MSILDWFSKNKKKSEVLQANGEKPAEKLQIPEDVWGKCPNCGEAIFIKELEKHSKVCPKCDHHLRLTPEERLKFIFDKNSFIEIEKNIKPFNFLNFKDTQDYDKRLKIAKDKTKKNDAVIIGTCKLKKIEINCALMDFTFMGGSMGSVVGEKITRLFENACKNKKPVIVFSCSGGARMQEGILSLMQMAKTSGALYKLSEQKVPYISVLCDPTTGGTSASFAMLGDINIAEPGALITFAGPRIIEQTIGQKLPKGFQKSEFLLKHGMLDMVVDRRNMRDILYNLISTLSQEKL